MHTKEFYLLMKKLNSKSQQRKENATLNPYFDSFFLNKTQMFHYQIMKNRMKG